MKFKIAFTVDAQTMFSMMAKFLPIDNLSVEEVLERPIAKLGPAPQLRPIRAKLATLPPRRIQHAKPKPKQARKPRPMDLKAGVNGLIMDYMADGQPHRAIELKPVITRAGFSENSIGSRLERLKAAGVVFQPELGLWQLAEARAKQVEPAA